MFAGKMFAVIFICGNLFLQEKFQKSQKLEPAKILCNTVCAQGLGHTSRSRNSSRSSGTLSSISAVSSIFTAFTILSVSS